MLTHRKQPTTIPYCSALGQLLVDAAMSYTLRNARRPADQQLPPVAFMVVDVDQAPRTFHELFKFETVPHTLVFPVRVCVFFVVCRCGVIGGGWRWEEGAT